MREPARLLLLAVALSAAPHWVSANAAAPPDSSRSDTLKSAASERLALEPFIPAANGELSLEPAGIATDGFGRVFASDVANHRLIRFDARGQTLGTAGGLGSERGELRRPGSVALLGNLSVVVLDLENYRIVGYDLFDRLRGVLVDLRSAEVENTFGRIEPVTLATDRGGGLYVADSERDRILAFDFSGRPSREIGGFGPQAGQFRGISGVALSRQGLIVTVERVNRRVQILSADGAPRGGFDLPPVRRGGALAVAVDDSLHIAVCDEGAGLVWLFDRGGRLIGSAAGLERPRAVAFDREGAVLVAESGSGRILRGSRRARPAGAR